MQWNDQVIWIMILFFLFVLALMLINDVLVRVKFHLIIPFDDSLVGVGYECVREEIFDVPFRCRTKVKEK